MPYRPSRRSRALDSDDDEEDSRPQTPTSTAPNDRKRIRRTPDDEDSESEDGSSTSQSPPFATPSADHVLTVKPPHVKDQFSSTSHQPGAIVRVKLTNFVTYSSAEFKPGPSLNMVIGPNGTGKSTLVCAICLGLGFAPQLLGRAKDAAEYVKHGCAEATIEIELQCAPTGKYVTRFNPVFKRIIKRDGSKSLFFYNRNQSTARTVQQMARGFNIQIDNLCQFLPQDKVVEFAQMSPIAILESTQKAAAEPEMIKMHQELKELRVEQTRLLHANRGDNEALDNLLRRHEMSRTEVERMRERAVAIKKLGWLEKLHPVPQYHEAKKVQVEAKRRQRTLQAELQQLRRDSDPALRKVDIKQRYQQQAATFRKNSQKHLTEAENNFDDIQNAIGDLRTSMEDCEGRITAEKTSARTHRAELTQAQQRKARYESSLEHRPADFDSRAINLEVQEFRHQIRQSETRKEDAQARTTNLNRQKETRNTDSIRLAESIQGLETQTGQQEGRLKSMSRDTHTAWTWIRDNQKSFQQQVYGPPVIECSLDDTQWADGVESFLQKSDFLILTVQNQRDFEFLQKKLNTDLNLHDVRLRTCSDTSLDGFRRPVPADALQQFGFSGYAIDHLIGPPTVLAMLCHEKRLHASAIATREVSQDNHDRALNCGLTGYYSRGKRYQFVHRREYGDAGSMAQVRDVPPASCWTKQAVDMGRKATYERELAQIKGEIETINGELKECAQQEENAENEVKKLKEKVEGILKDKDKKQAAIATWRKLPGQIQQEEQKILRHQEFINGVRDRVNSIMADKNEYQLQMGQKVVQLAAATAPIRQAQTAMLEAEIIHLEATTDFDFHAWRNQAIKNAIDAKAKEEREAVTAAATAYAQAKELVRACHKLRAEAKRLGQGEGDWGFDTLLEQVGKEDWSAVRLSAEIDSQNAQIELTEGGNADVIREYEEREKEIERMQGRLADFNQRQAKFQEDIQGLRNKWEPELEALVGKISVAFGDAFAGINSAGQVAVFKASSADPIDCTEENGGRENGLDFANWAIHISVKFREDEPLSLLDSHRQSGGERALSTIFYLMALQSLSRAPFRVVDEINQGMDAIFERKVHERMVDIATNEGGSQYFLITPKLLSGLKYRRPMTVLCVVSGENVPGETGTDEDGNKFKNPEMDFRVHIEKGKAMDYCGRKGIDGGTGLEPRFRGDFSRESSRITSVGA